MVTSVSYCFSFAVFLAEPFDGGLRGSWLALQERAAPLNPKLHRLPQTLLYWEGQRRATFKFLKISWTIIQYHMRGCLQTFSIESSALPQRISVFDILPSASPKDSFTNDFMVKSLLTILTVKLLLIRLFIFYSVSLQQIWWNQICIVHVLRCYQH